MLGAGCSLDMPTPWATVGMASWTEPRSGGGGWGWGYLAHSTGIPWLPGALPAPGLGSAVSPGLGFLQGGPVSSRLTPFMESANPVNRGAPAKALGLHGGGRASPFPRASRSKWNVGVV